MPSEKPTIPHDADVEGYAVTDQTLVKTLNADNFDRLDAEVGDRKSQDAFLPQVKLKRWHNEANFSVRFMPDVEENLTPEIDAQGFNWRGKQKDVHIAEVLPCEAHPDGAFELDVILKERPADGNVLNYSIRSKGLRFDLQPALTDLEKARGFYQPENVIGSYAVYLERRCLNIAGQNKYRSGKAFHIFRPKARDANGQEVWCDLFIDAEAELLTVTVPQDFLDSASYPVTVDPAVGNLVAGASTGVAYQNYAMCGIHKNTAAGPVTAFEFYGARAAADTNVKVCVWKQSDKTLLTNGVSDPVVVNNTARWWAGTFPISPSLVAGTRYYVGAIAGPTNHFTIYYDYSASGGAFIHSSNSYSAPINLGTNDYEYHNFSVYVVYTATASARQYYENSKAGTTSGGYGSWSDAVSLSFTPDAYSRYLIIASWLANATFNTNPNSCMGRLYNSSDAAEYQRINNGTANSSRDSDWVQNTAFGIFAAPASPVSKTFKIQVQAGGSPGAVTVKETRIIAIKLDDSNDLFVESLFSTAVNSSTYTDKAAITFRVPDTGRYVIFSALDSLLSSGGTSYLGCKLDIDGAEYGHAQIGDPVSYGKPGWAMAINVNLTAGDHIIKTRINSPNGNYSYAYNNRIIAIRTDLFLGSHYMSNETRETTSDTAFQNAADSLSMTAGTAVYLLMGSASMDENSTSYAYKHRVNVDSPASDPEDSLAIPSAAYSTQVARTCVAQILSLSAGSVTVKHQWATSNVLGAAGIDDKYLVLLQLTASTVVPTVQISRGLVRGSRRGIMRGTFSGG